MAQVQGVLLQDGRAKGVLLRAFDKEKFSIDSGQWTGKGVPLQESWPGKVC